MPRALRTSDLLIKGCTTVELLESEKQLEWQQGNDLLVHFPDYETNKGKMQYAFVIKIAKAGAFASTPRF